AFRATRRGGWIRLGLPGAAPAGQGQAAKADAEQSQGRRLGDGSSRWERNEVKLVDGKFPVIARAGDLDLGRADIRQVAEEAGDDGRAVALTLRARVGAQLRETADGVRTGQVRKGRNVGGEGAEGDRLDVGTTAEDGTIHELHPHHAQGRWF